MHEELTKGRNAISGKALFLIGVSDINDINKDEKFLEEISKVFDQYETPVKVTASRNMLKNAYKNGR